MADLVNTVNSWLSKLKLKPGSEPAQEAKPELTPTNDPQQPQTPQKNYELELGAMNDREFRDFVAQQPERSVPRILQSISNSELQLKIIQAVTDEATLKRISRSELDKKLKRAAERQLRTTGAGAEALRIEKLAQLNEKVHAFFRKPRWEEAPELLSQMTDPALLDGPVNESSPEYVSFQELTHRLKVELAEHQKRAAEREPARPRIVPQTPLKPATPSLHPVIQASPIDPAKLDAQAEREKALNLKKEKDEEEARKNEARKQEARLARANEIEALLRQIKALEDPAAQLTHRNAGAKLRELQTQATALRRWKREFPALLDEAERLLKTLLAKRTQALGDAQWDSWARTDLAVRIQNELEKTIGEIEAETDPVLALKRSVGLTERLFDYAKEMRELGSLDRSKDHKIWEQFKSLSARGWVICDKMREIILEQLKTEISGLAAKEVAFTAAELAGPRASIEFKAPAFEEEAAARLKELQTFWKQIGAKPSEQNRETEVLGSKLFEIYFRQFNLHHGKQRRTEAEAIQKKRELLDEMKVTCEGKSSLLARTRVAKSLQERWEKTPMPESVATTFEAEFEGYRVRLTAELAGETEKAVALGEGLRTQAQSTLQKIRAKTGTSLPQALQSLSPIEADLRAIEQHLSQFAGAMDGFVAIRDQVRGVLNECRAASESENAERAREKEALLSEAQNLALSSDWAASDLRIEELRSLWKKAASIGQSHGSQSELLFENALRFYRSRAEAKDRVVTPEQREKCTQSRKELIYSLDALARFKAQKSKTKPAPVPLPFGDEERAKSAGKTLAAGIKYNQILALDPEKAIHKETLKIMDQWSKLGGASSDDESLGRFWSYYLTQVRTLLL